jgi:hypothetical protein
VAPKQPSRGDQPVRHVIPAWELIEEVGVHVTVASPIRPGDPITYQWTAQSYVPVDLGTVSYALYLVDDFDVFDQAAIIDQGTLSNADSQRVASGSFFTSPLHHAHPPAGSGVEKRVYHAGVQQLQLELTGTGKDGPFDSQNIAYLAVALPVVDDSWWIWTVPASRSQMWKKDKYVVSGSLENKALQPLNFSATLLETNASAQLGITPVSSGETTVVTASGSALAPGAQAPVTSASVDLSKAWSWFLGGIFTPSGPVLQRYDYRVRLDLSDQFANAYPTFITTNNVSVVVDVSQEKLIAEALAVGGLAEAAIWLGIAAVAALGWIPGLIEAGIDVAIAAACAAAAAIAGQVAGDPPVPDVRYRSLIEPTSVEFPDDERLTPLTEFLAVAAEIVARADALGKTDSRIAGARAARGARKSLAEQLEQFNAIRAELPQLQKEVRKRLPVAAEWLAESGQLAALSRFDQATARLSRDLPFRAQMQRSWAEAGGDPAGFAAAEQLLAMPEMSEALTRPEAVFAGIGLAAERLAAAFANAEPSE